MIQDDDELRRDIRKDDKLYRSLSHMSEMNLHF